MSLQLAAQHLAAQGRGPDKQLVHMSPREVAGLQALAMAHGGSLTTNPDTGLPEAGALDNLLPAIIGAGLMFATGGAATPLVAGISNPALIGLGIGGLETMRTGNLQKGIMAGLGAYGGAGLTAGLAGPGMAVTNPAAPQIAMEQAANVPFEFGLSDPSLGLAEQAEIARAAQAGVTGAAVAPLDTSGLMSYAELQGTPQSMGITPATEYAQFAPNASYYGAFGEPPIENILHSPAFESSAINTSGGQSAQPSGLAYPLWDPVKYTSQLPMPDATTAVSAAPAAVPAAPSASAITPRSAANYGLGYTGEPVILGDIGVEATGSDPALLGQITRGYGTLAAPTAASTATPTTASTFAERFKAMPNKDLLKYGLAAAAPVLLAEPKFTPPVLDTEQARYAYTPGRVADPYAGYPAGYRGEYTYFRPQYTRLAAGGPVEAMSAANVYDMQNARGGVSDMGIDNSTGMQKMARGGISDLGDYSDGGRLLKGPGDGVSDSIPAMIGAKQPARLADGEFVVPARIVSELGNGSTDAGARKLYAMMDRIQKARGDTVGKGKVAKNSKAEKYLPA